MEKTAAVALPARQIVICGRQWGVGVDSKAM